MPCLQAAATPKLPQTYGMNLRDATLDGVASPIECTGASGKFILRRRTYSKPDFAGNSRETTFHQVRKFLFRRKTMTSDSKITARRTLLRLHCGQN